MENEADRQMDLERVFLLLRDDLEAAKKRLEDTTEYLDLAIQHNRRPGPTKITQERVRCAARSYREAIARAAMANARLEDFEVRGLVPDDLQLRRSLQKSGTLSHSQKTAWLLW